MHSFSFYIQENHLFFSSSILPPHWPESDSPSSATSVEASIHASLSQAPIEIGTALHTFKAVCVVVIQDPSHVLRFRLIEGSSYVQACHVHRWSYHCTMFHHKDSFLLAIPSVFRCWQLIPSHHPCANFSTSPDLFPSPSVTVHSLRTIWTLLTSKRLPGSS